jgi:phosphoribosylformylglycinamidine (FGAM) synthase PurS component
MLQTINIFVHLKNVDLHCQTAESALKNFLGFSELIKLNRYILWEISLDEDTKDLAQKEVKNILDNTYYLVNPNKEQYILENLPPKNISPDQKIITLKVTNKAVHHKKLAAKITRKTGLKINNLEKNIIWEFKLESKNKTEENLKALIKEKVNFLANPLFETYEFL